MTFHGGMRWLCVKNLLWTMTCLLHKRSNIATIIGDISSVKDVAMSFVRMETKSLNEEDCLSIYYQQVKEAIITNVSVGATGGGAIGGGIGFELGILGGLIVSLREIKELGREYVRCVA